MVFVRQGVVYFDDRLVGGLGRRVVERKSVVWSGYSRSPRNVTALVNSDNLLRNGAEAACRNHVPGKLIPGLRIKNHARLEWHGLPGVVHNIDGIGECCSRTVALPADSSVALRI